MTPSPQVAVVGRLFRCGDADADVDGQARHLTEPDHHARTFTLVARGSGHRHAGRGVNEASRRRSPPDAIAAPASTEQRERRSATSTFVARGDPFVGLLEAEVWHDRAADAGVVQTSGAAIEARSARTCCSTSSR